MISAKVARYITDEIHFNNQLEKAQKQTEKLVQACIESGCKKGLYKVKMIVNIKCITVEFVNELTTLGYEVVTEAMGDSDVAILNVSWCK